MKGTYIFLAHGYEPLEALAPMDILRRGGVNAQFVSTDEDYFAESTQGYSIVTDLCWEEFLEEVEAEGIECMIFPGGLPGADNLGGNSELMEMMLKHFSEGGLTCAICAAPARVLAANLKGGAGAEGASVSGRTMTAYAGFESELEAAGAKVADPAAGGDKVVTDGNLITAKGPGLAMDFGFAILTALRGPEVCAQVRKGMML